MYDFTMFLIDKYLMNLAVSLREGVTSRDPECSDSVRVLERGKTLLHMCGESNDDIILMSQRNKLEVRIN